jgi:hypothetical protein
MSVALIALVACTAPGCNPIRFEWQGPSSAFNLMDPNHDGRITRAEWEQTSQMTHPDETFLFGGGSAYEFLTADCDGDGVYTWHEYFQSRFKRALCETTRDDFGVAKFLGVQPAWSALAAHWPALRTATMSVQFEEMLAGVPPGEQVVRRYAWPTHYREIPLAPGQAIPVRVVKTHIDRRSGMPKASWIRSDGVGVRREAGDYDVLQIELVNDGKVPIAVVMLEIRAVTAAGDFDTFHVKSVHIAPSGREQLEAWYPLAERRMVDSEWVSSPLGAQAAEVTVLGVRTAGSAM